AREHAPGEQRRHEDRPGEGKEPGQVERAQRGPSLEQVHPGSLPLCCEDCCCPLQGLPDGVTTPSCNDLRPRPPPATIYAPQATGYGGPRLRAARRRTRPRSPPRAAPGGPTPP